ncbi:Piso0_004024 [Millerozyma farinosa CBS 7064]|uniref:Autophagy-related protein 27 n=1 Tax=Pichia sorbitophila (strain ATCC MYA-4447 / BCRC 22081 / CBS 7064 / NBRC 10061 / NRRL Y-12695) TaxID=559304 RepID=G8YA66_PICSO|nr:Piso0_004024 [Millerozyma farinosa CBS 7064]CCE84480.1 Piso0_004024 [Millerozyma farinosa CBS 7064]
MKTIAIATTLFCLLWGCLGIDCSAKELKPYKFEDVKGIYSVSAMKDTPPTQSNRTWYIGICETINEDLDSCPKNSDICGITRVIVDKKAPEKGVLSEVIGLSANKEKSYVPIDDQGISIMYENVEWGSFSINAQVDLLCPTKDDKEADIGQLKLVSWDESNLTLSLITPGACLSKKDQNRNNKGDNGESWGWFTWIFIFLVLFLSIYIIGGAWFQYNKGNSIDFQSALREVIENFVDLLRGLPSFIKEIIEKFTGNSNRGEYSAV